MVETKREMWWVYWWREESCGCGEQCSWDAHNTVNSYGPKSCLSYETLDKVDADLGRMIDDDQWMQGDISKVLNILEKN